MTKSTASTERPKSRRERPPTATMVCKGVIFELWQWEQTLFDGSKVLFEQLVRPDTVLVLPVLSDGQVVLAEETQPGTSTVIHTIGGKVEPGEHPEEAARRELLEESGLIAEHLRLWDVWQPVDKIDWAVFLFVAHGVTSTTSSKLDAGEDIKLRTLPATKLLERNSNLLVDDNELMYKLYFARADDQERERVIKLLDPRN